MWISDSEAYIVRSFMHFYVLVAPMACSRIGDPKTSVRV